jgi:hypothetical protein
METEYYQKQIEQLVDLTNLSADKQLAFFQQLLVVASGILGIVVSLHTSTSPHMYVRILFVVAIAMLAIGILMTVVVLFDHARLVERVRQSLRIEIQSALKENRKLNLVSIEKKKRTLFCEKGSLCILSVGLIELVIYASFVSLI